MFNSDHSGVFNGYAKHLETGEVEALSSSDDNSNFDVSWFPNYDRVLLTGDVGGNEHNSIFVRDPDGTWRVKFINADSRNEVTIRNMETGQSLVSGTHSIWQL